MDLKALIAKTEASLAAETDPGQLRVLEAKLGTLIARAEMDDDDDDDDGSKSAKHAKRAEKLKAKAKATDLRSKSAQKKSEAAALDDEAKKCEEEASGEDEEEARLRTPPALALPAGGEGGAALALLESVTGRSGAAAVGAAMAKFARLDATEADVAALKSKASTEERSALLTRAGRYVPPHLLAALETQSPAALSAFVTEAEKGSPLVHTEEGDLIKPRAATPGTEASLPADIRELIDAACANSGLRDTKALRADLVKAHLKDHNDRLNAAPNGAGRY